MERRDDLDTNRPLSDQGLTRGTNQPGTTDTTGDVVGEVTGGVAGAATGAALGSLGGPIGTLIGALAGAVGGWWSGRAISEAASTFTDDDESYYRTHYGSAATGAGDAVRTSANSYDDVRPAYQLGHLAGRNPDYANRTFDEVEPDLQRGWTSDVSAKHGDWSSVRHYARDAYDRGRGGMGAGGAASTAAGGAAYAAGRAADHTEGALDRTTSGAANLGDRLADKMDDLKDRVDGNPASRPGVDSTDSPRRL